MAKLSDLVNGPAHNNESHGQQHNGNEANSGMDTSSAVAQNAHVLNPFNIPNLNITDVWETNLEEIFAKIRTIIDTHYYVAMDTEFPGVVARPQGQFKSHSDYTYQSVRCNVELLKIIQLGLAFFNEAGELHSCYQFNFKFDIQHDMFAKDSIDLLQTSGIQFSRLSEDGVDILHFAELLMVSGLVLVDSVKWISFHSSYDYGYLLKLLCNRSLPETEDQFYSLLQIYFPLIYDVKFLMKSCKALKGGLSDIGEQLDVARIGPEHQAGSDSILTAMIFFKMVKVYFEDHLDDDQYAGQLFGLGANK
ncbi:CCR4-NOT transcription complex subunit 7-like [Symsagittifera roscoffensis]|uniref:CCR4-NOT transcription complex subunit 7-like n=1 Tax=Symsagittifera roscoffensis TaxID=84072 RepID=UPI00307BDF83